MPCPPDLDMVECFLEAKRMKTWALELENGRAEKEKAWVKKGNPYLLIKAVISNSSPLALKLAYSQGLCKWHRWITHARIDENPAIRGHDLCFDKTCQ